MELKVKNLLTVTQVANVCGYFEGAVRHAIRQGVITSIRPYPTKLGSDEQNGPVLIVADERLREYLDRAKFNARDRFRDMSYNPVFEAGRYVDWV
jgi:hypothetical protein